MQRQHRTGKVCGDRIRRYGGECSDFNDQASQPIPSFGIGFAFGWEELSRMVQRLRCVGGSGFGLSSPCCVMGADKAVFTRCRKMVACLTNGGRRMVSFKSFIISIHRSFQTLPTEPHLSTSTWSFLYRKTIGGTERNKSPGDFRVGWNLNRIANQSHRKSSKVFAPREINV